MPTKELTSFIEHARKKGMDHSTIRMLLLSAGWKEKEIAQAVSAQGLDMSVPTPPDVAGAREAFLHLLSFAGLYTLVVSLAVLFFQYINRALPDAAYPMYSQSADFSGIRMSMAAIIVSFPLLLWMTSLIHKEITQHPEKAWSGIRRWLTYLTLFVASTAMMIDVITLIFSLLEGELSLRFLLKVAVVFLLAGGTFLYYFSSLKSSVSEMKKRNRIFGSVTAITVLVASVWGIFIVGSPETGRKQKFDDLRLQHLRTISSEIYSIVYDDGTPRSYTESAEPVEPIPNNLQVVMDQALYTRPEIIDPETGEVYDYSISGEYVFELCANFAFERDERYDIFWNHPAGYNCFEFDTRERNRY